jgi:hypothetical protein
VNDDNLVSLFTQGGLALVIAASFIWLIRTVGVSMVAAIERATQKIDEHTKQDLASHAGMREDLARLDVKLDNLTQTRRKK